MNLCRFAGKGSMGKGKCHSVVTLTKPLPGNAGGGLPAVFWKGQALEQH